MYEQFGAPQAAMAGMYQTPAHQQFAQQYQGAPPRPYGQRDMMQANAQMQQRPAWAPPGAQYQQQPRQAPVAYARPMAQNAYGNQLAQQQPRQMLQAQPAPQRAPQMRQPQAYQRVQQNANAIQQAQARPLGAGAGAAAAAQGIRSPSAPGGQIGSAAAQGIQSPTAPINPIQRNTMARI